MPARRIHTQLVPNYIRDCQVAQKSRRTTKTCQRVWLPKRTGGQQIIKHENTTSL